MEKEKKPTLRDLYPTLSDEELRQVEENLDRYLELVLQIFERLELNEQDNEGK